MPLTEAQQRADLLVQDFYKRTGPPVWPHVDRSAVAGGPQGRLRHPIGVNQGALGVCGLATVVHEWLLDDPVSYVWLAISLYEKGVGYFGRSPETGKTIRPSAELRQAPVAMQGGVEMNHVDWIILTSL